MKEIFDALGRMESKIDKIDDALRDKQIKDAAGFAKLGSRIDETEKDINAVGKKIRDHVGEHFKFILWPSGAVLAVGAFLKMVWGIK